jgi:hypothetical protein
MKCLPPGLVFFLASTLSAQVREPAISGSGGLPPLPESAFTIVVIPDTQHYTGRGCKGSLASDAPVENAHLAAQVEWILTNIKKENIVFVTHVGDIVEDNRREEWTVAKEHLDRLRGIVPFREF